jgi:hypothetical protein
VEPDVRRRGGQCPFDGHPCVIGLLAANRILDNDERSYHERASTHPDMTALETGRRFANAKRLGGAPGVFFSDLPDRGPLPTTACDVSHACRHIEERLSAWAMLSGGQHRYATPIGADQHLNMRSRGVRKSSRVAGLPGWVHVGGVLYNIADFCATGLALVAENPLPDHQEIKITRMHIDGVVSSYVGEISVRVVYPLERRQRPFDGRIGVRIEDADPGILHALEAVARYP